MLTKQNREDVLIYLLKDCGVPYIWGGQDIRRGVDCSGFVQLKLAEFGMDPAGDQTAQGLYNHFIKHGMLTKQADLMDLVFFGASVKKITHVGIALNSVLMVEAGGGNQTTRSAEIAQRQGARVRVRSIKSRNDLVATIKISGLWTI